MFLVILSHMTAAVPQVGSFTNMSFEDAGDVDGCASGWTFACHSQYATAEFDSGYAETFDWFALIAALVGSAAVFNDDAEDTVEGFEQGWNSNQEYVFNIDGGIAALFETGTPEAFEDFEEEWSSNESYKYAFTGVGTDLTAASFDTGTPESIEDFEEEWSSNESYKYAFTGVGTDLTAASFDTGVPEAVEDFEEEFPTLVMTTV